MSATSSQLTVLRESGLCISCTFVFILLAERVVLSCLCWSNGRADVGWPCRASRFSAAWAGKKITAISVLCASGGVSSGFSATAESVQGSGNKWDVDHIFG
jgi:hypothetical protein